MNSPLKCSPGPILNSLLKKLFLLSAAQTRQAAFLRF